VSLPRPGWKVVRSAVNVPVPKWKTFPTLSALNSSQLKDLNIPNGSRYSKNLAHLPEDNKEAANSTKVVIPRLFKNQGSW